MAESEVEMQSVLLSKGILDEIDILMFNAEDHPKSFLCNKSMFTTLAIRHFGKEYEKAMKSSKGKDQPFYKWCKKELELLKKEKKIKPGATGFKERT